MKTRRFNLLPGIALAVLVTLPVWQTSLLNTPWTIPVKRGRRGQGRPVVCRANRTTCAPVSPGMGG